MKFFVIGLFLLIPCSSVLGSPTGIAFADTDDFKHSEIEGTTIECSRYERVIIFTIKFCRPERHSKKNWRLKSILALRNAETEHEYDISSSTELADKLINVIRFSVPEGSLERLRFEVTYHDVQAHNGRTYEFDLKSIASKILARPQPKP